MMEAVNLLTAMMMSIVTAVVIVWDVFLASQGYRTVSDIMLTAAREFMIIPVAWGVLAGHFFFWFWPGTSYVMGSARYFVLAAVGVIVLLWDLWMQSHPFAAGSWLWWLRYPMVWLVVGVVVGRLFFPQDSNFNFDYLRHK